MKQILPLLLALLCLKANSQCCSGTTIQNPTFSGQSPWLGCQGYSFGSNSVFLSYTNYNGTTKGAVSQVLNLPLCAFTTYTFTISIGNASGTDMQCLIYAGYGSCDLSGGVIATITPTTTYGTQQFTYHATQPFTSITIEANSTSGIEQAGVGFSINDFAVTSNATGLTLNIQSDSSCYGSSTGTATVNASPYSPYTYQWSNGQTASTINSLAPGNYSVTVTDAHGCSAFSSVTIAQASPPSTPTMSLSNGVLTASQGTSYQWYFNGNLISGATGQHYIPTQTGNYSVAVANSSGCYSSQSSYFYVNSVVNFTSYAQVNHAPCYGDSTDMATVHASGSAPYTYHWSNGVTDSILQNVSPGIYIVTVTDSLGTTEMDTANIVTQLQIPTPTISLNGAVLTASYGSSYQWYFNGNIITGATNQSYTPTQNGNYSVAVSNSNGCASPQSSYFYIAFVTGLTEITSSDITIYPNPATNEINIRSNNAALIFTLYDLTGREITSKEISGTSNTLDVSQISKGAYIVKIQQGANFYCQKIIIQ